MRKAIGYALIYKNRESFVVVDGAFYNNKKDLGDMQKEVSQRLKKKVYIRKIFYTSIRIG